MADLPSHPCPYLLDYHPVLSLYDGEEGLPREGTERGHDHLPVPVVAEHFGEALAATTDGSFYLSLFLS